MNGERVATNPARVWEAFGKLRLASKAENDRFHALVRARASEMEANASDLLRSLSHSNIKTKRGDKAWPKELPGPLVTILYTESGIDVTVGEVLKAFYGLGFDARLAIDVVSHNREPDQPDLYDLQNLRFEIQEAYAVAEDPENGDFELDLRIGFDRVRLTIRADELKPTGNRFCAQTRLRPGEGDDPDYDGHFAMRLLDTNPLSWAFEPVEEGDVLKNRIEASGNLARIETQRGAGIVAELTARREAMKVRIVGVSRHKAQKTLAEQHRDRMCAAVARRSIAGSTSEYVVHRQPLQMKTE